MEGISENPSQEITEARKRLDELDGRIIRLLKERMSFSALIQGARVAGGGCRTDSRREKVIISRYHEALGSGGSDIGLSLLRLCRSAEPRLVQRDSGSPLRRAFLGPAASVSQYAAEALEPSAAGELVPLDTLEEVISNLLSGQADEAVVPLENSVSGPIHDTLYALAAAKGEVAVTNQKCLPVQWVLATCPGTHRDAVNTVASHPHALAQTRQWLASVLPAGPALLGAASTSAAAAGLLQAEAPYEAVICTRHAAEHYRLEVLAAAAETSVTRFVLLRSAPALHAPSGSDVTSMVATVAGPALTEFLVAVPKAGIHVVNLHSLPDRGNAHAVWLDCVGHAYDARMVHALAALRECCEDLYVMGSYPALGPHELLEGR